MRKLIIILLFILEAFLIFQMLFQAEDTSRFYDFVNTEVTINSHRLVFEVDPGTSGKAYETLSSLADQLNANLVMSRLINEDGGSRCIKYVYITRPEFYQDFTFEGTPVYPAHDSHQFLSTVKTGNPEQIGRIVGFTGNNVGEIRTLYELFSVKGPFQGFWTLQTESRNVAAFCEAFTDHTGLAIQEADKQVTGPSVPGIILYLVLAVALLCIHLLVTLILYYDLVKDARNIALEKMLGYGNRSIWIRRVRLLLLNQALVFIVVLNLMLIARLETVNAFTFPFMAKLLFAGVLALTLTLGFAIIIYNHICRIDINTMLKHRQSMRFVAILNTTVKISLLILIIFLSQVTGAQLASIADFREQNNVVWEDPDDYRGLYVLSDIDRDYLGRPFFSRRTALYFTLNGTGGILADFTRVSSASPVGAYTAATINPNYLAAFPLFDADGERVSVDEEANQKILLVPMTLRSEETQIRQYFEEQRKRYRNDDVTRDDTGLADQEIVLIWLMNDQPLFTWDHSGTPLTNVILSVLTENNASVNNRYNDYDIVVGLEGDPFRIRARGVDPEAEIHNLLKNHDLGDSGSIISVFNSAVRETERSSLVLNLMLFTLAALALTLVMVIVQSVDTSLEQNRYLIGIRTFLGFSFPYKYKLYIIRHMATAWAIIAAVSLVLAQLFGSDGWRGALIPALNFLVLDIIISFLTTLITQKQKILNVLKGDG